MLFAPQTTLLKIIVPYLALHWVSRSSHNQGVDVKSRKKHHPIDHFDGMIIDQLDQILLPNVNNLGRKYQLSDLLIFLIVHFEWWERSLHVHNYL